LPRKRGDLDPARDLDALVALYEDGAAFVPQPGEVVTGKEALREALQGFLATGGKIEVSTRYAARSGDTALLSGMWRLSGTGGRTASS
jgi:ketosteroid isomerase-like protein